MVKHHNEYADLQPSEKAKFLKRFEFIQTEIRVDVQGHQCKVRIRNARF